MSENKKQIYFVLTTGTSESKISVQTMKCLKVNTVQAIKLSWKILLSNKMNDM